MILSIIVFIPLLLLLAVAALPSRLAQASRWIAISAVSAQLLALLGRVLPALLGSGVSLKNFHLIERTSWIQLPLGAFGRLDIDYFIGMDGARCGDEVMTAKPHESKDDFFSRVRETWPHARVILPAKVGSFVT